MKLNTLHQWDLNKLHVFRAVAESASLRAASQTLLRTPSALSQSVSGLEAALGLKLFDRKGSRLELTEVGARLLERVQANERSLLDVLGSLAERPEALKGRVHVGVPTGYPALSLASGLSQALLAHPGLQLRLRFLSQRELARGLLSRELECALSLQRLAKWSAPIRSTELRQERLVLVIPKRFRQLSHRVASAFTGELPVVDYYQKPLMIEGWLKHHRLKSVQPQIRVYAENFEHVMQFVRHGVGCAVAPLHAVQQGLASGDWVEHRLDRERPWAVTVWFNALGGLNPQRAKVLAEGLRAL